MNSLNYEAIEKLKLNDQFSANCQTLDTTMNITVAESELPAEDGDEVSYTCPRKHVKKVRDAKAFCQNGTITFNSTEVFSPCFKIG